MSVTVRELIAKLVKMPGHASVLVKDDNDYVSDLSNIEEVDDIDSYPCSGTDTEVTGQAVLLLANGAEPQDSTTLLGRGGAARGESELKAEGRKDDVLALLRGAGWTVAVHNDYRQNNKARTFWLFTHPEGRWVKGEGSTDEQALITCLRAADIRPRR